MTSSTRVPGLFGQTTAARCALFCALRLFPSLLLLVAGISKIIDPLSFQLTLFDLGWFSFSLSGWVATFLPPTEILVGGALLLGHFQAGAALLALILFLVFVGALSYGLITQTMTDCGCLGIASLPPAMMLLVDLMMLACVAAHFFLICRQEFRELKVMASI